MNDVNPIPEFLRQPVAAPRERPILFSAPMIRALLAGTKTQTRRSLYTMRKCSRASCFHRNYPPPPELPPVGQCWTLTDWRRAKAGDRLYVRENAWQRPERTQKMMREGADTWPPFIYDADYPAGIPWVERDNLKTWGWKRRPSIHLPRLGSRILLEIAAVRVERLNDISESDALAEGARSADPATGRECLLDPSMGSYRLHYRDIWEQINGQGSWALNPFVWVLEFQRVMP